jgi:hypothetical protein
MYKSVSYQKLYDKLVVLKPGQRNRLRRRTKNNYDRLRKEIADYKKKYDISRICNNCLIYIAYNNLCLKLKFTTQKLVIVDNIIDELDSFRPRQLNKPIIRYNNGEIVPFDSMDYLIISNIQKGEH